MASNGISQSFWWTKKGRLWTDMLLPHHLLKLRFDTMLFFLMMLFLVYSIRIISHFSSALLVAGRHPKSAGFSLSFKVQEHSPSFNENKIVITLKYNASRRKWIAKCSRFVGSSVLRSQSNWMVTGKTLVCFLLYFIHLLNQKILI